MLEDIDQEATPEEATVAPHEAAIILGYDGFRLLIPKYKDDDEVPDYVMAIVALAMKLRDETYMHALAEECRRDMSDKGFGTPFGKLN